MSLGDGHQIFSEETGAEVNRILINGATESGFLSIVQVSQLNKEIPLHNNKRSLKRFIYHGSASEDSLTGPSQVGIGLLCRAR